MTAVEYQTSVATNAADIDNAGSKWSREAQTKFVPLYSVICYLFLLLKSLVNKITHDEHAKCNEKVTYLAAVFCNTLNKLLLCLNAGNL